MDKYVKLAKDTIEMYIKKQEIPEMDSIPVELRTKRAGCFVSIHKKNGSLRGCIGTIRPVYKNLAGEIISNAVAAATQDTRFEPINENELDNLSISVDILSAPESIESEKDLDIKKYGLIVQAIDGREGLLLPDIEGIDSIDKQISIAREKAGIDKDEQISLYRFAVERHTQ